MCGSVRERDGVRRGLARGPRADRCEHDGRERRDDARRGRRDRRFELRAPRGGRVVRVLGRVLLGALRARHDLATNVSPDDRLRRPRRIVQVRRRVLLARLLRARRNERRMHGHVALRAAHDELQSTPRLLQQRLQQRHVSEAARSRVSPRGRDVQRKSRLLRRCLHDRVGSNASLRAPSRLPRRGRDLLERERLLLGRVQRRRALHAADGVQHGRWQRVQERRVGHVRDERRLLLAQVPRAARWRVPLRAHRWMRAALRAMHGRRGLLLGIVRGRTLQGSGGLRFGRRGLHRESAMLRRSRRDMRDGSDEPRRASMRIVERMREHERLVRGGPRLLRRQVRARAGARVREHVLERRTTLHDIDRLLQHDIGLLRARRHARLRASHSLTEDS